MEHSTANVLAGDGATSYARNNGFEIIENDQLLSEVSRKAYKVSLSCSRISVPNNNNNNNNNNL